MKTVLFLLSTIVLSASANSNDINIDFGCLDCRKSNMESKYEKKPQNYKNEKNLFKDVEVSGSVVYQYDKYNK